MPPDIIPAAQLTDNTSVPLTMKNLCLSREDHISLHEPPPQHTLWNLAILSVSLIPSNFITSLDAVGFSLKLISFMQPRMPPSYPLGNLLLP